LRKLKLGLAEKQEEGKLSKSKISEVYPNGPPWPNPTLFENIQKEMQQVRKVHFKDLKNCFNKSIFTDLGHDQSSLLQRWRFCVDFWLRFV